MGPPQSPCDDQRKKASHTMSPHKWHKKYRMACEEFDPVKCRMHIETAEELAFFRTAELRLGAGAPISEIEEFARVLLALGELHRLKGQRLGWPGYH
jgi:hypothetical protein